MIRLMIVLLTGFFFAHGLNPGFSYMGSWCNSRKWAWNLRTTLHCIRKVKCQSFYYMNLILGI